MGRNTDDVRRGLCVLALAFLLSLGCGAEDISSGARLSGTPPAVAPKSGATGVYIKKILEKLDSKDVVILNIPDELDDDTEESEDYDDDYFNSGDGENYDEEEVAAKEREVEFDRTIFRVFYMPNVLQPMVSTQTYAYDEEENSHVDGRFSPSTGYDKNCQPYIITDTRLKTITSRLMYPFYDQGGDENYGDYQRDIHSSAPQIQKNLDFQLPFYGFSFDYVRVSMHGYLEFSDPPPHYTYPLIFPVRGWPIENDPSFIGIFYSRCRVGAMRADDLDQRRPGVYFRTETDLQGRTDQTGVETRERLMWDITNGIAGASDFKPKHAVIVTWKSMSFSGGIDNALYKTNTFQVVLATDEVQTYAIFNYADLQWTTHTEAGGDTTGGGGGVSAFVGFNAGNGTGSFEYHPYSQSSELRRLTERHNGNQIPGRHVFRIDGKITSGSSNKDKGMFWKVLGLKASHYNDANVEPVKIEESGHLLPTVIKV